MIRCKQTGRWTPGLVVAFVLLVSSCAGDEPTASGEAGQAQPDVPVPKDAEEKHRFTPPHPAPPDSPDEWNEEWVLGNPIDRSTAMGRLCWAVWEIMRHEAILSFEPGIIEQGWEAGMYTSEYATREQRQEKRIESANLAERIARSVADDDSQIPAEVREFAPAFADFADVVRKSWIESTPIDYAKNSWEEIPGAETFFALWEESQECARPF